MAKKNHILTNVLIFVAVFIGATAIAKFVAHKDAKRMYQQEQIARKGSNKLKPFTTSAHFETPDNEINLDVHVSETNNTLKYEMNGKTINIDKEFIFGEKCRSTYAGFDAKDPKTTKHIASAYYIYKHRNILVNWCAPTKMNNYLQDFDNKFGLLYKESVNYLNARMDNKTEICVLRPTAEARKNYEFAEFQASYIEIKKYVGMGDMFTKDVFCDLLNTSEEMRHAVLGTLYEDIQKLKSTEISSTFTDKNKR